MKEIKNIKIWGLFGITMLLLGCDLDVQERFVFEPDVDLTDPYKDITAWQFINTPQANVLNDEGELKGDSFNYFVAAIEAAGMVDEFNGANGDRTYLMLNNNAFLGKGDIINLITGSEVVEEGETPVEVMARADIDVLKLILKYHIIDTYIKQNDPLFEYDVNYEFQTLIPGDPGRIILRRDNRLRIDINKSPAPLPSTATDGGNEERIRDYNYVFKNGIGYTLADPVRNEPYPSPNL